MEMLALGRCDPFHLSDQPDPPDTSDAPVTGGVHSGAATSVTGPVTAPVTPATSEPSQQGQPQGDAFARLVAHLLALGAAPTEQEKRPVMRVSGQRRALVAG